ncbi:carbohydrate-binding module family 48 protein [Macrolepiota fuliginosa MF-IS2]|uniref:Carbohydrate-binding module family 48 protein n=1 Tax=Macrolepiota fuliginosa MF-IS2 TaxID=1400762 RepID=A0A9P5XC90_9AGAR|nr:carbohydrate-binding module family 48 protein [Macrolepiota fuliginosa MF-IS2]
MDAPPTRRLQNNFSSSELIVPATHLPFPPTQRTHAQSGSSFAASGRRSRGGPQPMQTIYAEPAHQRREPSAHQQPPTPPSPTPSAKEVVNSSIPIGLLTEDDPKPGEEEEPVTQIAIDDSVLTEPIAVKITWRGGGKNVVLARAGDDDWAGRQSMERENPLSNTWTAIVDLLPGTHHIRFLVDDQWRVSDELPTAVDDQGSLANYVNVQPHTPPTQSSPLPPVTPQQPSQQQQYTQVTQTPQRTHHIPGQSFWSASSSVDDGTDDYRPSNQQNLHAQVTQASWTSTLPQELIEAAREEEAYLTASAGQYDATARSVHVSGFVPAPNIPPAPGMPRHLDKLILNTRVTAPSQHSSGNSATGSPSRGGNSGLPGGVGSGQGGSSGRERDRSKREGRERRRREDRESRREERERERREQREREREERERREREQQAQGATWRDSGYANFPPAPPPSEDGSGAGLDEKPEHSPVRGVVDEEHEISLQESSNTTALTTPEPTPLDKESPPAKQPPPATARPTPAADPTQTQLTPAVAMTTPTPVRPGPSPLTGESRAPVSGSRAITLDMESMPALTDDGSVLPVPSHVVLQHLCTSAIRNGVLAVATTTRYRKKYMTTIYYKPSAV